jgi:hypothetical protein
MRKEFLSAEIADSADISVANKISKSRRYRVLRSVFCCGDISSVFGQAEAVSGQSSVSAESMAYESGWVNLLISGAGVFFCRKTEVETKNFDRG